MFGRVGLSGDGGVEGCVGEEEDSEGQAQPPELDPPAVRRRIPILFRFDHKSDNSFRLPQTGSNNTF